MAKLTAKQKISIPEDFVNENLGLADQFSMFGIPLTELTSDELLATAAWLFKNQIKEQDNHFRTIKMFRTITQNAN